MKNIFRLTMAMLWLCWLAACATPPTQTPTAKPESSAPIATPTMLSSSPLPIALTNTATTMPMPSVTNKRPLAKDYFASVENKRGMIPIANAANVHPRSTKHNYGSSRFFSYYPRLVVANFTKMPVFMGFLEV